MILAIPMTGPGLPGGSEPMAPGRAPVQVGELALSGELLRVPGATGLVVMLQAASGEAEHRRNRLIADVLRSYGLSTLLVDLLGDAVADDSGADTDTELLHLRLEMALCWLLADARLGQPRIGLLGSGPAAAAALRSAVRHPAAVSAVVSRGGTPGQARAWLPRVLAPTLLVVGGDDGQALASHRAALRALPCEARLEVLPRVSRRFDEPGVTETVAHLAGAWFARHLAARSY